MDRRTHRSRRSRPGVELLEGRRLLSLSTTTWTGIGPGPIMGTSYPASGRVNVAVPDPKNSDVMYVGTPGGGVWMTDDWTDTTPTWTPLTETQASLAIPQHGLALFPAGGGNPAILYAEASGPGGAIPEVQRRRQDVGAVAGDFDVRRRDFFGHRNQPHRLPDDLPRRLRRRRGRHHGGRPVSVHRRRPDLREPVAAEHRGCLRDRRRDRSQRLDDPLCRDRRGGQCDEGWCVPGQAPCRRHRDLDPGERRRHHGRGERRRFHPAGGGFRPDGGADEDHRVRHDLRPFQQRREPIARAIPGGARRGLLGGPRPAAVRLGQSLQSRGPRRRSRQSEHHLCQWSRAAFHPGRVRPHETEGDLDLAHPRVSELRH